MSEEAVEGIRRVIEEFNLTRRSSIEERQRAVQRAASGLDPEIDGTRLPIFPTAT